MAEGASARKDAAATGGGAGSTAEERAREFLGTVRQQWNEVAH